MLMMKNKIQLLLILGVLGTNSLFAEQLTVYRWVDENNIVHFSQHQPSHDNYTEINMANNTRPTKAPTINQDIALEKSEQKTVPLSSQQASSKTNTLCQSAKENLKILQEFDNIRYKDSAGKTQVLSKLERKQQLEMNTKQVEVYCTNK